MNRLYGLITTLLAVALLLTACGGQPATEAAPEPTEAPVAKAEPTEVLVEDPQAEAGVAGFPVTVTDGLGRELTFDEPPQRVVAIYNGPFGTLATLGVRPVATLANASMLQDPRYFEDGESIPSVAGPDGEIDLEKIASFEPDLIMVIGLERAQSMESIAPTYVPIDGNTIEDVYAEVRNVGKILGLEERAEEAIRAFQNRLAAYKQLAPADVSVMVAAPDGDNLGSVWLRTEASNDCQLLNEIAECAWEDPTGGESWSYQTMPETLLELNPDFIYFWREWDGTREELYEFVRQDPLWAELDAVQNGRLLHVPGYNNPIASSLIAATQLLDTFVPLLYPDIFPAALTEEQVQEILAGGEAGASDEHESATATDDYPVTVVDGDGVELTFSVPPERVVCLDNKCVEDMAFIGIMPYAVGAPNPYRIANDPVNFGDAAADLVQISSSGGDPNFEEVAAIDPDLIVGWSELRPSAEGIAPFFSLYYGDGTLEGGFADTRALASILGRTQEVEEKIENFEARLEAYDQVIPDDVSILITDVDEEAETFWIAGRDSFAYCWVDLIAECASTAEVGGDASVEALLALDPDVLVLLDYEQDPAKMQAILDRLAENPLWQELSAFQNERIFTATPTTARFTSPQGALNALNHLIPRIFPDLFPNGPLTDEEVQEIVGE